MIGFHDIVFDDDMGKARLLCMVADAAFRWLYMADKLLFIRHRTSWVAWLRHAGYQMVVDALRDIDLTTMSYYSLKQLAHTAHL